MPVAELTLSAPEGMTLRSSHNDVMLGALYSILNASSPEYTLFLHNEGYRMERDEDDWNDVSRKNYKLFTYSGLRSRNYESNNGYVRFPDGRVTWKISSPKEEFWSHFYEGLKKINDIRVSYYLLNVCGVKELPAPSFQKNGSKFICLSPIVVTDRRLTGQDQFLLPDSPIYIEALRTNLINKTTLCLGREPKDKTLRVEFDQNYLSRRSIVKTSYYRKVRHLGVMAPLKLSGSMELIETAYYTGLGSKNSSGFGMIQPV